MADAVDAQQVLLGLTHEVAHGLDAHLAELVGPALAHAEVVEEVELGLLGRHGATVAGERAVAATHLVVIGPVELLRQLLVEVLELLGRPIRQRLGVRGGRTVDGLIAVGRAIGELRRGIA